MAAILCERCPGMRGKVAAVHSKMYELRVPGQAEATVHEVLAKFRALGAEPSVLINVDMLTEGFDDPKIRSVVLARLALSTIRTGAGCSHDDGSTSLLPVRRRPAGGGHRRRPIGPGPPLSGPRARAFRVSPRREIARKARHFRGVRRPTPRK